MPLSDFFVDTQNPNPNTSRERQMGEVLCILSSRRVFVIDMDCILEDEEDYKKETPLKRLPVKRTLDFLKSGLPIEMGLAKWGNSLYMFGGYTHGQSATFTLNPRVYGVDLPAEDLPRLAYMFDVTNDEPGPVQLSSMSGPKLFPIVEVIEDKIYVLSKLMLSIELPMFEVFCPKTRKWKTLPPPLPPCTHWHVQHYTVCGGVITCQLGPPFFCDGSYCRFNTITEQWEYPEDITTRELICMLADPDVRNKDVYLTFGKDEDFWAMDERGWSPKRKGCDKGKDGYSVGFDQSDIYPVLGHPFYRWGYITLADTRDPGWYNCGLVQYHDVGDEGCNYPVGMALHIVVFQVEKLEGEDEPAPLSIRYLRRQVYEFKSEDEQQPYFTLEKAIIGRVLCNIQTGGSKCSREEQGRKEKKQPTTVL